MRAEHPRHFLHRLQAAAQGSAAPDLQEGPRLGKRTVAPKVLEGFLEHPSPARRQLGVGQAAQFVFGPAALLKLYLYGYLHRVRSSRLLEAECQRNVEVIWLLGKLAPDFKTIADFRKDNLKPLKAVNRQFTVTA